MIRPMYPDTVREYLAELSADECGVNKNKRGAVRKHLGDIIPDDSMRRRLLSWLFYGSPLIEKSTSELTGGQVEALHKWIGAEKMDDVWIPNSYTITEIKWCLKAMQAEISKSDEYLPDIVKAAIELGGVITEVKHV